MLHKVTMNWSDSQLSSDPFDLFKGLSYFLWQSWDTDYTHHNQWYLYLYLSLITHNISTSTCHWIHSQSLIYLPLSVNDYTHNQWYIYLYLSLITLTISDISTSICHWLHMDCSYKIPIDFADRFPLVLTLIWNFGSLFTFFHKWRNAPF